MSIVLVLCIEPNPRADLTRIQAARRLCGYALRTSYKSEVKDQLTLKFSFAFRLFLSPHANQSFLNGGGDKPSVMRKDRTARQAAPIGSIWALLRVEQPVVDTEAAMKPKRVIQTCDLHIGIKSGSFMQN